MNPASFIATCYENARAFETEALRIFSHYESTPPRIISLSETRRKLVQLSLRQQVLFDQAIRCAEFGLPRPAIVIAWSAFIHYYESKLGTNLSEVHRLRPNWAKFATIDDIVDNVVEFQMIELGRDVGLFRKNEAKAILGLLSKRNECAHPSTREPGMNEAIGYISELLDRISDLAAKPF